MRVAIIIPTCDRPDMLQRAVRSAIEQEKPAKVVVVNDGSTPLPSLPSGVSTIQTKTYEGLPMARKIGVASLGPDIDAIGYVDDDDELLPNHVKVLSERLMQGHAFAFSRALYQEGDRRREGDCSYNPNDLLKKNVAPVSSFMHAAWALEQIGGWDPRVARLEDWDVWGRLTVEFGPPSYVDCVTNIIHRHGRNHLSDHNQFSYSLMCFWRDMVEARINHAKQSGRGRLTPEESKRMSMPKVCVLMPVYNAERYLRQAMDSVLAQTFADFEVNAVNDGSTDGSRRILEEYSARDRRVRLIDMPGNSGVTKALNHGLLMSRSPYIARMDADDVCLPDRFEKQVAFLDARPDVAILGTRFLSMSEDLERVVWDNPIETDPTAVKAALSKQCCVGHPTVMFRRKVAETIGGYDESPASTAVEDYEFWLRASRRFSIANLPDVLLKHRVHEQQVSKKMSAVQSMHAEALRRRYN